MPNSSTARTIIPDRIEVALALLLVAWTMLRTWWLIEHAWVHTDDQAYTALRYARHLVDGHGLAWNPGGTPVEGYANFTFVLLGAGFIAGGFDPIIGLKMTGAISLLVAVGFAYVIARRWLRPALAALPGAMMTAHFGTVWWSASGLETSVAAALVLATVALALQGFAPHAIEKGAPPVGGLRFRWFLAAGICAALLGLTRPETPLVAISVAAAIAVRGVWAVVATPRELRRAVALEHLRAMLAFSIPFLALWGTYFVARWVEFGRAYPQPVYCKRQFRLAPYEMHWVYWRHVAVFAVFALLVPWKRRDVGALLLLGPPLLYVWAIAYVHPITGSYDRYFVPTHALVVLGAVIAVPYVLEFALGDRARRWRDYALVVAVFAHHGTLETPFVKRTEDRLERLEAQYALREDLALWLDARVAEDEEIVIGDVGLVGFLAHKTIVDSYCINNPDMTRAPVFRNVGRWMTRLFETKPEWIVVHNQSDKRLRPIINLGIYPTLVAHPLFTRRTYERTKTFTGASTRYFVYRRKQRGETTPPSGDAQPVSPGDEDEAQSDAAPDEDGVGFINGLGDAPEPDDDGDDED